MFIVKSFAFTKKRSNATQNATQNVSSPSGPGPHSPLSPLSPNSPLYPDGIMTPLWITKHAQEQPGVVLGIYELWERLDSNGNALKKRDPLGAQTDLSPERENDTAICADVNLKRYVAVLNIWIHFL